MTDTLANKYLINVLNQLFFRKFLKIHWQRKLLENASHCSVKLVMVWPMHLSDWIYMKGTNVQWFMLYGVTAVEENIQVQDMLCYAIVPCIDWIKKLYLVTLPNIALHAFMKCEFIWITLYLLFCTNINGSCRAIRSFMGNFYVMST